MNNQELSAMIAEEVSKAVAPLYQQFDEIRKGNKVHNEEETRQEPDEKEETPDFTPTAKRLRAKGLIK